MEIEIVLLDLDGTIFDFNKSEFVALQSCFQLYGYKLTDEIYEKYHIINSDLWQKFENNVIEKNTVLIHRFEILFQLLDYNIDPINFSDQYQLYLSDSCELVDGTIEILDYLHKKYKLYAVTNGLVTTQKKRLKKAELIKYFSDLFISEEIGFQKPNKEFFDHCFKVIGAKRKNSIIIGDSLSSDILGGNIAGIKTCWFNPHKLDNAINVQIDYEISELYKIIYIL